MPYLLQARNQITRLRDPSDRIMYELTPDSWALFGAKPDFLKETDKDVRFKVIDDAEGHDRGRAILPAKPASVEAKTAEKSQPLPTQVQRRGAKAEENIKQGRRGRKRRAV